MDTSHCLLFVLAIAVSIAVFLTITYLSNLLDRFNAKVSVAAREFVPVVARGAYLGLSIALLGGILALFVGSLWPIPVMVFLASITGLVRRVLPPMAG